MSHAAILAMCLGRHFRLADSARYGCSDQYVFIALIALMALRKRNIIVWSYARVCVASHSRAHAVLVEIVVSMANIFTIPASFGKGLSISIIIYRYEIYRYENKYRLIHDTSQIVSKLSN